MSYYFINLFIIIDIYIINTRFNSLSLIIVYIVLLVSSFVIYNSIDYLSIIDSYLFGNCNICNVNILNYIHCEGCNLIFCKSCYIHEREGEYLKKQRKYFNYCTYCIFNMILNDN